MMTQSVRVHTAEFDFTGHITIENEFGIWLHNDTDPEEFSAQNPRLFIPWGSIFYVEKVTS